MTEFVRDHLLSLLNLPEGSLSLVALLLLACLCVAVAWLAGWLCRLLLIPFITKIVSKTRTSWDDILLGPRILVPACRLVPAIILWRLLPGVFDDSFPSVAELLRRLCAVWITLQATAVGMAFLSTLRQAGAHASSSSQQYLQSFCGVLKVVLIFCAVIIVAAILIGRSPLTLFAGLGATSAILMLVFKDTIEGLVAGVRLTSNDMVHKGDWITVQGTDANGIVEDISLTTVKVRNFDNTIITISPKSLVDGSFQNWKGMKEHPGRRLRRVIYVDYRTIRPVDHALGANLVKRGWFDKEALAATDSSLIPSKAAVNLTLFRRHVEALLAEHPDVVHEAPCMVRQLPGTDTGLPIEIYCFIRPQEWVPYEHAAASLMEQIYALVPAFGLEIYQRYPHT